MSRPLFEIILAAAAGAAVGVLLDRTLNAHIDARFDRLEIKMADDTQSILDAIDAEDAEIERVKTLVGGEFQALKDQIAAMPGPNVDKAAVLARLAASTQKVTGINPDQGNAPAPGGGTPSTP